MAGMALVQADVVSLTRSWVVRLWLVALLISFLVVPAAVLVGGGPQSVPASSALAAYLAVFLNVWSIVIIVLSAGSVSSESDIVADSILSRACTRPQYILAKLTSRALVIGGIYLIGASAAAYVCWRYGAADVTLGTMVSGIAIVGLALLMLVALGVAISAVFNNTIISIVGLLLLWHIAGALFAFAGVEYMSPTSLTGRLPEILRDSRAPQVVSCWATDTSVSIVFSKRVNPESAEKLDNYTIENPEGDRHVPQAAVYDAAAATVRLSGLTPEVTESVTVTVDGVTDDAGNVVSPGANEATAEPPPAVEDEAEEDDEEGDESDAEADGDAAGDETAALHHSVTASIFSALLARLPSTPASAQDPVDDAGDEVVPAPEEPTPDPPPAEGDDEPEPDPAPAEGTDEPAPGPVNEPPTASPDESPVAEPGDGPVDPPAEPTEDEPTAGAEGTDAQPEADPVDEAPAPEATAPPEPALPARQPVGNHPALPARPHAMGGAAGLPAAMPSAPPGGMMAPGAMPAMSAQAPTGAPVMPSPPPAQPPAAPPSPQPAPAEASPPPGDPTERPPRVTQVRATRTSASVTFSQDMDADEVAELGNYTIESPEGTVRLPMTAVYDPPEKTVLLSGLSFAPGDPVKVSVAGVSSEGGTEIDPRHNGGTFSEVQTWKYLVGFGIPALLFALVGVVWFSYRDL